MLYILDATTNLNVPLGPASNTQRKQPWRAFNRTDSVVDLHAGLRSLNFNYGVPRANIQMNFLGPFVGLTYHLDG